MNPQVIAQNIKDIYSFPDIIVKLNQLINDPNSRMKDIVSVIECDPALTLKILRLSNSSFYGFNFPIDNIDKAAQIIGLSEIHNFAIGAHVVSMFDHISTDLMNTESFWHNNMFCGFFAKNLALHCELYECNPIFIAGLLHSIGRMVMCLEYSELYRQVLYSNQDCNNQTGQIDAEKRIFGFDYSDLSYEILKEWKIPDSISLCVKSQLNPNSTESEILHVASSMMSLTQNKNDISVIDNFVSNDIMKKMNINHETLKLLRSESFLNMVEMLDIIKPGSFKL